MIAVVIMAISGLTGYIIVHGLVGEPYGLIAGTVVICLVFYPALKYERILNK